MNDKEVKTAIETRYKVKLTRAEDLYNLIWKYGKYTSSYNDLKYSRSTAVSRFLNGLPLNCGNYSEDIVAPVLRALGYLVNIWLCRVKCANGWYGGHWLVKCTGRRWENKIFDGVSAVYHKPFGTPVCSVVKYDRAEGNSIRTD